MEERVLTKFNKRIKFVNDRYEVYLPWKEGSVKCRLMNNKKLAPKRFKRHAKVNRKKKQKTEYYNVFEDYEKEGIIEVPADEINSNNPVHHMPNHLVMRELKTSIKLHPVFDASAKSYDGISLNDCLHTGP